MAAVCEYEVSPREPCGARAAPRSCLGCGVALKVVYRRYTPAMRLCAEHRRIVEAHYATIERTTRLRPWMCGRCCGPPHPWAPEKSAAFGLPSDLHAALAACITDIPLRGTYRVSLVGAVYQTPRGLALGFYVGDPGLRAAVLAETFKLALTYSTSDYGEAASVLWYPEHVDWKWRAKIDARLMEAASLCPAPWSLTVVRNSRGFVPTSSGVSNTSPVSSP